MAGSTAPTALAGTLVQTVAESLAALIQIELVVPGAAVIVGMWPFVTDLRTGAFSGGGGEEALLNSAAAQILNWYGLTGSVSGGITDAKLMDNQCGFEKGMTAALTSVANGGLIGESAGNDGQPDGLLLRGDGSRQRNAGRYPTSRAGYRGNRRYTVI